MKRWAILFVLGWTICCCTVGQAAENLALGKPYTMHPAPNYKHCTDPDDRTQLTDGVLSEGYFWVQKETVGWRNSECVDVIIDLG